MHNNYQDQDIAQNYKNRMQETHIVGLGIQPVQQEFRQTASERLYGNADVEQRLNQNNMDHNIFNNKPKGRQYIQEDDRDSPAKSVQWMESNVAIQHQGQSGSKYSGRYNKLRNRRDEENYQKRHPRQQNQRNFNERQLWSPKREDAVYKPKPQHFDGMSPENQLKKQMGQENNQNKSPNTNNRNHYQNHQRKQQNPKQNNVLEERNNERPDFLQGFDEQRSRKEYGRVNPEYDYDNEKNDIRRKNHNYSDLFGRNTGQSERNFARQKASDNNYQGYNNQNKH